MSQAVRTIGFACGVIAAIVGYFLLMSALLDAMIALGHGGLVRSYNATVMVIKGIPAAIFLVISYVLLKRFLHEHRSARVVVLVVTVVVCVVGIGGGIMLSENMRDHPAFVR